ncbi:hypothetical protein L6R53_27920 [Myxococcota bacterium]|nr:hypothetical protein [Myxococcota bacterium]
MSDTPFVLPAGLVLRQDPAGLTVEYAGTIELHSTLGGRVARLSSSGGDVVLGVAMEVGTIEAAGDLRAAGALQVGDLVAGSAQVAGDLRADNLRVDGVLRCDGDLSADRMQAQEVHCAGLDATELLAEGTVETSGNVRLGRARAGALRCGGELLVDELTVGGEVATLGGAEVGALAAGSVSAGGDLKVARAEVGGALSVGGRLEGEHVEAGGDLDAGGEVRAGELAGAHVQVGGSLQASSVRATALKVAGGAQADSLACGSVEVGGDLAAGSVDTRSLKVGGDLRAPRLAPGAAVEVGGAVEAGDLQVASLVAGGGLQAQRVQAEGALRLAGTVVATRLEADTIEVGSGRLEVRVIQGGSAVRIGALPVRADIVIAPTVTLAPKTSGRISVVESATEVGSSKVKGCLSLEDLEDLFGNAEQFLAERQVVRLGGAPPPKSRPLEDEEPPASEPDVLVEVEDPQESMLSSLTPGSEQSGSQSLAPELAPAVAGVVAAAMVAAAGPDDERTIDELLEDGPAAPEPAALEVELDLEGVGADAGEAGLQEVDVLGDLSELDPLPVLTSNSALEPLAEATLGVQVDTMTQPAPASGAEDDLFGWADQMLTEVVAQGAINHPDADLDDSPTGGVARVKVSLEPEPALEPEPEPEPELTPEPAPQPEVAEDPLHSQMQDTVSRIVTCYVHTEMPPAVARLKDLVDSRDYVRIRSDITEIWNQLLKFHQKRGMRIQPQVTTTFNTINSLVRKL